MWQLQAPAQNCRNTCLTLLRCFLSTFCVPGPALCQPLGETGNYSVSGAAPGGVSTPLGGAEGGLKRLASGEGGFWKAF